MTNPRSAVAKPWYAAITCAAAMLFAGEAIVTLARPAAMVITVGLAVAMSIVAWRIGRRGASPAGAAWSPRLILPLVAQLSPVILLTIAFPLVQERLAGPVGNADLSRVTLAISIVVPWLAQVTCMPLYTAVGRDVYEDGPASASTHLLSRLPLVFVASLAWVVVATAITALATGWNLAAMAVFGVSCALHVVFLQSMVPTVMRQRHELWALSWACYAAVLVLLPRQAWALSPLAGLAVQFVVILRERRPAPSLSVTRGSAREMLKGLGLGALLWSDKALHFWTRHEQFNGAAVFAALLPAVVVFNVYFVVISPIMERKLTGIRGALERDPIARFTHAKQDFQHWIFRGLPFLAVISAAASAAVAAVFLSSGDGRLFASMALANWCLVLGTLLAYNLALLGRGDLAYALGIAHLIGVVMLFSWLDDATTIYFGLALVDTVLLIPVLAACVREWMQPEYGSFWKHATSW